MLDHLVLQLLLRDSLTFLGSCYLPLWHPVSSCSPRSLWGWTSKPDLGTRWKCSLKTFQCLSHMQSWHHNLLPIHFCTAETFVSMHEHFQNNWCAPKFSKFSGVLPQSNLLVSKRYVHKQQKYLKGKKSTKPLEINLLIQPEINVLVIYHPGFT